MLLLNFDLCFNDQNFIVEFFILGDYELAFSICGIAEFLRYYFHNFNFLLNNIF